MDVIAIVAQVSSEGLVEGLRGFLLPIVLLLVGIGGVAFLITQRAAALLGFLTVAIIVTALLTTPELIRDFGEWIGSLLRGSA